MTVLFGSLLHTVKLKWLNIPVSHSWETPLIAVIVAAHNQEDHILACLASISIAARCPNLKGERVVTFVALDDCTDSTRSVVQRTGVTMISLTARNVGAARALGAQLALAAGARWLAFTDADTEVAPDWLSAQAAQSSDAVCGTVAVSDEGMYGRKRGMQFAETNNDADGQKHLCGANLGVCARAYERAGGFKFSDSGEDAALVKSLQSTGASIVWSTAPHVWTNSRRHYRAPGRAKEMLARVERESSERHMATADA